VLTRWPFVTVTAGVSEDRRTSTTAVRHKAEAPRVRGFCFWSPQVAEPSGVRDAGAMSHVGRHRRILLRKRTSAVRGAAEETGAGSMWQFTRASNGRSPSLGFWAKGLCGLWLINQIRRRRGSHPIPSSNPTTLAAHRIFHRRQKSHAWGLKCQFRIGEVVIFTRYSAPNTVLPI
jgi:hypothetical protein